MGIDAFKTSSSKSTSKSSSSSSSSSSSKPDKSGNADLDGHEVTSEKTKIMPWLTAVWDNRREEVIVFKESNAFIEKETPEHQDFLVSIPDKRDYSRIRGQVKSIKYCEIQELFDKDKEYAVDLIERLKSDRLEECKELCPVCGEEMVAVGDRFIEVNGQNIHSKHDIGSVKDELEVEG